MRVVSFKPPSGSKIDGYDFDAFEVELHENGDVDFRLLLGENLDIYRVAPVERHGRLRLIHVDNAAIEIDPGVVRDPMTLDLELAWAGDGAPIESVHFKASGEGAYQCDLTFSDRPPVQLRFA